MLLGRHLGLADVISLNSVLHGLAGGSGGLLSKCVWVCTPQRGLKNCCWDVGEEKQLACPGLQWLRALRLLQEWAELHRRCTFRAKQNGAPPSWTGTL